MPAIKLKDYQLDAVQKMKNGCILCGGVGSGKSLTALTYYIWGIASSADLYIITTARKRDTLEWEAELAKIGLCTEPVNDPTARKIVVDSWNNLHKYADAKSSFFIFDEQRVVGNGAWVKAFLKIAKSNEWVLLSATPGDTWQDYIPVFIANGFYKNRSEFYRNHVVFDRFSKYPKVNRYLNTGRLIRLRNSILVNMDYKKKALSVHEDIYTDYDRHKYRDISRTRWDIWKEKPIENAGEYCYALRRVVNSSESRQIAVLELFEQHPRVIIFYNYNYELELLKSLGWGTDVEIAEWNGRAHQPIPSSEKWVYLVQYTAGAEGWNCIKTDTIIFYSENYSYKIMTQAAGRIDRLNTPYTNLWYYHLKSRSGIDLAISKALAEKKEFNEMRFMRGCH